MKGPACHITICGVSIPVRVGTAKDYPDLGESYGVYDVHKGVIWLNANVPEHTAPFWLVHEVLHVMLHLSGALEATSVIFGVSRDDRRMEEWEEALIRVLTPHVLETFGEAQAVYTATAAPAPRARRRS